MVASGACGWHAERARRGEFLTHDFHTDMVLVVKTIDTSK
jgi:hypothetical protein